MNNLLAGSNIIVESIKAFEPLYASLRLLLILLPLGIIIFLIIVGAFITKIGIEYGDNSKIKNGKRILIFVISLTGVWFAFIIVLEIIFAIF